MIMYENYQSKGDHLNMVNWHSQLQKKNVAQKVPVNQKAVLLQPN